MAQHDYILANQSGAAFRSDLNNGLAAIVSNNSGAAQPSTTYAYQWWPDTTTGLLKLRNAANNAWITIGTLADANLGLLSLAGGTLTGALLVDDSGTAALPAIAFDGDPNTGIFSPGADQLGIATNGVERVEFGTTEVVFNDDGADVDFRVEGDTKANLLLVDAGADAVSIDGNFSVTGSFDTASLNGGPLAGFRNRIINGDFQVWQRGVTFTNANGYTADRWTVGGTGTLCNVGQGGHPSSLGERVALNFTGVAGNTRSFALQKIESQNMASLYPAPYAATQVTLSVNIYSTSARTIELIADYANTADNFSALTNITSHSISVGAGTFNRYSHTFTLPAEAARGMQIVLNAQTGITSGTVAFSMVQLEPGPVATPFEQRPIGTELALCQRYYFAGDTGATYNPGPAGGNDFISVAVHFPVQMRTAPTMSSGGWAGITRNVASIAQYSVPISWNNGIAFTASAEL